MHFYFSKWNESVWYELPVFDLIPYISITIQYKATVEIKYSLNLRFGWLIFHYVFRINKTK
jgi:hypothetical protein